MMKTETRTKSLEAFVSRRNQKLECSKVDKN